MQAEKAEVIGILKQSQASFEEDGNRERVNFSQKREHEMGSEHNQQVNEHNQQVNERNKQVNERNKQVKEHNQRISEHNKQGSEHNQQIKENNGFNRLQEILKNNKVLLDQMCNRDKIKKVIVEAAVHHFSTLSSQKQLEVVAQYLERSGQA